MMSEHKYMWNHEGTALLISIWSDSTVQKRLQSTLRNQPIWDGVARYMMKKGFQVNGKQCRTRIKNILVRYREVKKTGNFNGSGIEPFYNELDRVLTARNSQTTSKSSSRSASNADPLEVTGQKNNYKQSNEYRPAVEIDIKSEQNSPPITSDESVQELHDIGNDSNNQQQFFESIYVDLQDDKSSSSIHLTPTHIRASPLLILPPEEGATSTDETHLEQEEGCSFTQQNPVSNSKESEKATEKCPKRSPSLRLERLVMRTVQAQTNSVTKILNAQNDMFMRLMETDRAWQTRIESKLDSLLERINQVLPNKESGEQDVRLNCLLDRLDWALPHRSLEMRNRNQETKLDSLLDKLDKIIPAINPQLPTK